MSGVTVWQLLQLCSINRVMKRIISILLSFLVVIGAAMNFSVNVNAQSTIFLSDCGELLDVFGDADGRFYLLANYSDMYKIITIEKDFSVNTTEVDVPVSESTYAYLLGEFYFIENSSNYENGAVRNYLTVTSYYCSDGFTKRSVINDEKVLLDGTFAVDSQGYYYISYDTGINVYSNKSILVNHLDLNSRQYNMTSSFDGNIVYSTNGNNLTVICGDDSAVYNITADRIFTGENNYMSTSDGTIYKVNGTSLDEICTFDYSNGFGSLGKYFIGRKGGGLCAIQGHDEIDLEISANKDSYIVSSGDMCGCFSENGGNINAEFFSYDEIERLSNDKKDTSSDIDSDTGNVFIRSDLYLFDNNKMIMTGVQPQTTIAVIKKNINMQGYSLTFNDHNGSSKSSGVIGTGANIFFYGPDSKMYHLVVFGDLSGEGNINSRDKSMLANHLLGKEKISDESFASADVNDDGICDLKDLVALEEYTNGQYSINQSRYVN